MKDSKFKALIVDDHEATIFSLSILLEDVCEITTSRTFDEAFELLQLHNFEILISDYNLGSERSGIDLFRFAQKRIPHIAACLISGFSENPILVDLISSLGGLYLEKPVGSADIDKIIALAHRNRSLRLETVSASSVSGFPGEVPDRFIAESKNMRDLVKGLLKSAPDPTLYIHLTGSTGTGKSALAKIIHNNSGVSGKLIEVNCATLGELSMSRLFGHSKGSFTGAAKDHFGFIHQASGGTLFLDDVHLLPKDVQGKLLQVLDNGKYQRLGETIDRESKFRLISAASVNVLELSRQNEFVIDLWFRMAGKTFSVPSLAERKDCIPRLVYKMIESNSMASAPKIQINPDALELLTLFSWDGNVRDLANTVKALCVDAADTRVIAADMVRRDLSRRAGALRSMQNEVRNEFASRKYILTTTQGLKLPDYLIHVEREAVEEAVRIAAGNQVQAAKLLGISRSALQRKL